MFRPTVFPHLPPPTPLLACVTLPVPSPPPGVAAPGISGYISLAQDARGKSGLCQRADAGITTHKHYHTLVALSGTVDPTDDAYTGSSSASPPLIPTLLITARSDAGTQAMDVFLTIDIKFYIEFFNPLAVTTS